MNVSDVAAVPELEIMALTKEGSLAIAKTKDSRQFFVTCHAEYDANTLALEYNRDMEKGLTSVDLPINYFPDDDPTKDTSCHLALYRTALISNWLNSMFTKALLTISKTSNKNTGTRHLPCACAFFYLITLLFAAFFSKCMRPI